MQTALTLFNRTWWWKTLLVLLAMAVMVRLGLWQLDRLDQRRAYNAELAAKLAAAPLVITGADLPEPPAALRNRKAVVQGEYDYAHQIAVKNQNFQGQPGVHLVTPLRIQGSDRAILVVRGWVPVELAGVENWPQFEEEAQGPLSGYLQTSQKMPGGATSAIPDDPVTGWFRLDIEAIQTQMPYLLLPVALQLEAEDGRPYDALPKRVEPDLSLSEGNHLSYAIQWFAFAIIAGIVYIALVRQQEQKHPPR
ncbi:MAG: SURF1 family protein [Caldilineae bacterium]|nr:MAG: SURF1 family protein [Caldilineae bacterium]